jgi:Zn-dependent protease
MFSNLNTEQIVYVLVSMIIAMSFHEAVHAFIGHVLGDTTAKEEGRLTLNPLKHIDIMTTIVLPVILIIAGMPPIFAAKPVPFNPYRVRYGDYGAATIAISGPLSNLFLAILASVVYNFTNISSASLVDFIFIFTAINVSLFVFNLIPFPPLDGSRLVYAFAPESVRSIMNNIEAMGFMPLLLILLVLFQFIGDVVIRLDNQILLFLLGS